MIASLLTYLLIDTAFGEVRQSKNILSLTKAKAALLEKFTHEDVGFWRRFLQDLSLPPVPTIQPTRAPVTAPTEDDDCSFKIAIQNRTWDAHKNAAQRENCTLASILSQNEFDSVVALVQGGPPAVAMSSFVYIGGRLRQNGTAGERGAENWEWIDGSEWSFEKWSSSEPNNSDGDEDKVAMRRLEGRRLWNDVNGSRPFPAVYRCCEESHGLPEQPTSAPTVRPSRAPTARPTLRPTARPTQRPTARPTRAPTAQPTSLPTARPTSAPTGRPTPAPTAHPTSLPTARPTPAPTPQRTVRPTESPGLPDTARPTETPTRQPTFRPTGQPTQVPTRGPTQAPTSSTCEFLVSDVSLSWTAHRQIATGTAGCDLASILDEVEHNLVLSVINNSPINNEVNIWIGGAIRVNGTQGERGPENWEWIDGSSWEYENFWPFEPNNELGVETVLSLLLINGERFWNDKNENESYPAVYKCCNGDIPPTLPPVSNKTCVATGWGDPHLVTFDGLKYDCHAGGEVIMVKSLDSNFEIQARLGKIGFPAYTAGIVVRERDTSIPIVQISLAARSGAVGNVAGCPVDMYVDGIMRDLNSGTGSPLVIVTTERENIRVRYPVSGTEIRMSIELFQGTCLFSVDYQLPRGCLEDEQVIGLLGSPNGNMNDDWMTRDGRVLDIPPGVGTFFFEPAYLYCSTIWCMRNASESLFTYEPGFSFDDISKCDSGFDRTFQSTIEAAPQCLIDLCAGDIGCLIDGVTLGIGAAKSYLRNPAINVVECSPSEPKPCYFSCADALQTLCVAESGLYEICPDGTNSMSVYCDQSTDGGGWMLLLSYSHTAGENAPLVPGVVPLDPEDGYSHVQVNNLRGYTAADIENVRFFCTTSAHNRAIHFSSNDPIIKQIAFDGDQRSNRPSLWRDECLISEVSGNTAILPTTVDSTSRSSTGGFTRFPFFEARTRYWSIRAMNTDVDDVERWECDDFLGATAGTSTSTVHNVFVRMSTNPRTCNFRVVETILDWPTHRAAAVAQNCNLASLLSQGEHDEVIALIDGSSIVESQTIWLGGTIREGGVQGQPGSENWEWLDGSVWEFENFHDDEPNNEDGVESALSLFLVNDLRLWNDEDPTEPHPAIYKCCTR